MSLAQLEQLQILKSHSFLLTFSAKIIGSSVLGFVKAGYGTLIFTKESPATLTFKTPQNMFFTHLKLHLATANSSGEN